MSYCPECGSEVAQNDVFCAYCGIGLPNVSAQPMAEESAIEYSSTADLAQETPSAELLQNDLTPLESKVDSGSLADVSTGDNPAVLPELPVDESTLPTKEKIPLEEPGFSDELISIKRESDQNEPAPVVTEEKNETEEVVEIGTGEEIEVTEKSVELESPVIETESKPVIFDEITSSVEEISEPASIVEEADSMDFEQTIPDSYNPEPQKESGELEVKTPAPEVDDENKLKSVLDEIDLNLPSPDELSEDSKQNGVVIPTAANLQQEAISAVQEDETSISPSGSGYASAIQTQMEKDFSAPVMEKEQDLSPIAENIVPEIGEEKPMPIADESIASDVPFQAVSIPVESPVEKVDSLDKDGRAFTNPNMGIGDTDNRNKTKLKPLDEGTVLNSRYEIVRKIGGGGMGAVYLATDKNLGGVLRAVKEMVQSYIEDDQQEKAVNDFKRESLLLTSLEHTAIPTIYDYFYDEKENRFYLVMKYISGGDLAARLRSAPEGRIDEVSVTDWAIQIADVLDYLHNRQPSIVYRDLKPSNIMIDGNTGKLMLIDFGIARWVNNKEEKGVTAVGTMGYAPPELFSGNVEPRSDIYSLGSTMFHLLTGADPQSNPLLIFDFNKNPKPRQINPQLSDQMEQILMRSVEYNSTNRFNSALEMREALIKHMENLKKGAVTFGVINTSAGSPISSNVPVFCGFCGQKIVATDMFCPFCGAQQPLAAQSKKLVQPPPMYAAPTISPRLMIVGTNDLESTDYLLEKDSNLLGRRDPMSNIFPEVDLSKYDPQTKISRKHARIWREGDVYMLEDLGSSNGTTLTSVINGSIRLLPRQPQVLSHGDKIKLGDTTLRFTVG